LIYGKPTESKTKHPVYEKDSYSIDFQIKELNGSEDIRYSLNLYYGSQNCKVKIKNAVVNKCISCVVNDWDSFYYYKRYDLQKNEEENLLGEIEYLKFQALEGIVEEYNMKDHLLNKISIFYMKLIPSKKSEGLWLYIKGIDGKDEIVNKRYFMKFPKKYVGCSQQFGKVQNNLNKYYNTLAKKRNEIFFWEVDESFKKKHKLDGNLISMGIITYGSDNTDNSVEVKGTIEIKNAIQLNITEGKNTKTVYLDNTPYLQKLLNGNTNGKIDLITVKSIKKSK
jgi:hypothetical protein